MCVLHVGLKYVDANLTTNWSNGNLASSCCHCVGPQSGVDLVVFDRLGQRQNKSQADDDDRHTVNRHTVISADFGLAGRL